MADIADMLVAQGLQSSANGSDFTGAMQKGAELAQSIQNMQEQRQKLELAKQQHHMEKVNRVMDAFEKGEKFKDTNAKNNYFKHYLPGMIKALQVDDVFNPEIMQFAQGSAEVRNKMLGLRLDVQNKINNGDLRGAEILDYVKSKLTPEELADFDGEALVEQQKFGAMEAFKTTRAETVQASQFDRQRQGQSAAGDVKLSQDVASDFAEYNKGGAASLDANKKLIKQTIDDLKSSKIKTGTLGSFAPTDIGKKIFAKDLVVAGNKAKKAIQASLKQTLGSQFTKEEGERVENRTFDAQLSNEDNIAALQAELDKIEQTQKNAENIFRERGFLGNKPAALSLPKTMVDNAKKLSPADQQELINRLMKKFNASKKDVKEALEL